ncbi:hypothetical protein SY27_15935 [Flavobacterium sp. 316]|uniref:Uncharacterized protein n=1 Tax=Flavobacterium sediminilitoris TaxID=2024526 RepID=A0ABY4HNF0_9FLAO|nr:MULTISPECIES: hypothetical protein [Flavobacterium]KIX20007.1 hypothetical protein SY27_15935 [Flavobacterium sp. 316]UOX33772.1 hypothetical protein LXD69_17275 [Flavobacterium sediminilitoris]
MSKKTKAFFYNFLSFTAIYIPALYILKSITNLEGFVLSITAFVISLVLGPKFQYLKTNDGEKIFMKWIFVKGIKEVK